MSDPEVQILSDSCTEVGAACVCKALVDEDGVARKEKDPLRGTNVRLKEAPTEHISKLDESVVVAAHYGSVYEDVRPWPHDKLPMVTVDMLSGR